VTVPRKLVCAFFSLALAPSLVDAAGIEEIDAYYRVAEEVASGGQPTGPQIAELGKAGFRTMLSLRDPSEYDEIAEADEAIQAGMRFISVPVGRPVPAETIVEEFLAVTDDAGIYPVFIHCGSGNRVGALWMIRRVLRDGWDIEAAEPEADRIGLSSETLRTFARDYIREHSTRAAARGTGRLAAARGGRS
jgi:uncharacterized protein (TIGR01244 family)